MKYKIYQQDVIKWAEEYQKGKFHALISDAPYHLTTIVKRFGKKDSAPAQYGTDGVFSRTSKGFMGQEWDGGDVAFRPETWEALCDHLFPGGFGMVFSASRNWHRLAVAIEDAGMIIHPTIFGWLSGQGFPKATNISKQLDKGKEGEVIGQKKLWGHNAGSGAGSFSKNQYEGHTGETRYEDIHAPASELSAQWAGHRYGLQALKPAVEPIIVFQKPYEGKPLDNIVSTGAGTINIDGGRIPLNGDSYVINTFDDGAKPWGDAKGKEFTSRQEAKGRWPANFILDESASEKLDRANRNYKATMSGSDAVSKGTILSGSRGQGNLPMDDGGVSRYFFNVQEQIDEADPIYYCSKVSPKERNAGLDERCVHPTMKPIALAKYLATLLLPPDTYAPRRILVPFSGVGSEMIGCMQAGWEQIVGIEFMEEYVNIANKRMEYWREK